MDEEHDKKNLNWSKKLYELFDMEFITDSKDDILNSGESSIDLEEFRLKSRRIFRDFLAESPEDWRNSLDEGELAKAKELKQMPLRLDLSISELVEKINEVVDKLSRNQTGPFVPAIAYRSLAELQVKDLAIILRELQFVATENGIDLESNQ